MKIGRDLFPWDFARHVRHHIMAVMQGRGKLNGDGLSFLPEHRTHPSLPPPHRGGPSASNMAVTRQSLMTESSNNKLDLQHRSRGGAGQKYFLVQFRGQHWLFVEFIGGVFDFCGHSSKSAEHRQHMTNGVFRRWEA